MSQDNQHSTNQSKWTTIALAVLSSANAGIGLYILLLVSVSFYPLVRALLPPLRPDSAVKAFKDTVKAMITRYNAYKSLMDETTSFDITRVYELHIEALTLKERHIQAYQRLSLTNAASWVRYASDERKIWVTARGYQREIDLLKGKLKMAILQAKKGRVRVARGVPNNQEGDEALSTDISEHSGSNV